MRRLALLISIVAWTAGCGDQPPPLERTGSVAEVAPMPCQAGWTYAGDERHFQGDWRQEAVVAGPITLLQLNSHAGGDFRQARSLYTKVVLEPYATTTVAVAQEDRDWLRMSAHPPNHPYAAEGGDPGIRFEGCAPRDDDTRDDELEATGYAIAVSVDRPGCGTFEITPEGEPTMRRTVGFGVSGCG